MNKKQALNDQRGIVKLFLLCALIVLLAMTAFAQSECLLQCERQYSQCQGSPHICAIMYDNCVESCL